VDSRLSYRDTLIEVALRARDAGQAAEAEATLRLVVGDGRRDAEVLYHIGHLCLLRGDLNAAVFLLSEALTVNADHARAHYALGEIMQAMGRDSLAVPHLERAVALEPDLVPAYSNLAAALMALHRPDEALRRAREAVLHASDKAPAHCELGELFERLDRTQDALEQYHLALASRSDFPRARYLDAVLRLSLGGMPGAWLGLEERLRLPTATANRHFRQNRWHGEPGIAGRRILLHAEAGLGNTIQFVRYAPMIAELGATVLLAVQPELKPLLGGMRGVTSVHGQDEALPEFDLHCPLMSLPLAFRTSIETIPAVAPYLPIDPVRRAVWEQRLGPWRKMRVGLAWSGAADHPFDAVRSISLERLDGVIARSDLECHVIQQDIRDTDRLALAELPGLTDHSADLTGFEGTAALVSLMDLVISVDTAAAHLAGALGKPTWLLLAHNADWRWLRERGDSPWYPSLRLFRQPRRDDWQPVLDRVNRQLDQWSKLQ
jgi:hypothetical protein